MVQEQDFLKGKGEGWHFPYLIFSKLIIFTFKKLLYKVIISCRMQPTSTDISSQHMVHPAADDDITICWKAHEDKCLCCQADNWSILQVMMTLLKYFTLCKIVLCIWRKIFFFCNHNFMKKVILSCLKITWKHPIN